MIWTLQFWKNTLELVLFGAGSGVVTAYSIVDNPGWKAVGAAALSGAVLWLGKSLASNIPAIAKLVGKQAATPMLTAVAPHGWNPVDPLGE